MLEHSGFPTYWTWNSWDYHGIQSKLASWRLKHHVEEHAYTPGNIQADKHPDPGCQPANH